MLKSGYGRFRSRWLVCRLSPPGTINACRGFSFFSPTGYHLSHARCPQRSLPLDYFEPISALSRPPPISVRFSIPINTVFHGNNGNRPRHTGPFRIFLCAFGIHSGAYPHLNRLLFVRSVQFLAGRALSRPDLRHEPPSRTKVLAHKDSNYPCLGHCLACALRRVWRYSTEHIPARDFRIIFYLWRHNVSPERLRHTTSPKSISKRDVPITSRSGLIQ